MRRLALLGACAAATLAACMDPATPDRECAGCYYSFADTEPPDTLFFHWPSARLPVRYWADPRGNMAFLVQRAFTTWEEQFLYGEFTAVLVSDSAHADVLVVWSGSVPQDVPPDTGVAVPACSGSTHSPGAVGIVIDSTTHAIVGPIVAELDFRATYTAAQIQACLRRVAIHEVGHSLGLFNVLHSGTVPSDIMYSTVMVDLPSPRDRTTIEVTYHTRATVLPPPRP